MSDQIPADGSWRATERQMACPHMEFRAMVGVNRLEDVGRFTADITIACAVCDLPFHFVGVPWGLSPAQPMASVGGAELRAPIAPGLDVPWAPVQQG